MSLARLSDKQTEAKASLNRAYSQWHLDVKRVDLSLARLKRR